MFGEIKLKSLEIKKGTAFRHISLLESATDSQGQAVDAAQISSVGNVSVNVPGDYPMMFYFIDPHSKMRVEGMTIVKITE